MSACNGTGSAWLLFAIVWFCKYQKQPTVGAVCGCFHSGMQAVDIEVLNHDMPVSCTGADLLGA